MSKFNFIYLLGNNKFYFATFFTSKQKEMGTTAANETKLVCRIQKNVETLLLSTVSQYIGFLTRFNN